MRLPKNDRRPFTILLIGPAGTGTVKRDTSAWADADQAAEYGCAQAPKSFSGMTVEVIVLDILTNTAVICTTVQV